MENRAMNATVERIRAVLLLLGNEEITPTGRRMIERVLDAEDAEEPPEGTHRKMTAAEAQKLTKSVYLTREEAGKYLGVSAKTLAQQRHNGPDYYKFFGKALYKLSDLENWARQQKETRQQGWYPTYDRTYREP